MIVLSKLLWYKMNKPLRSDNITMPSFYIVITKSYKHSFDQSLKKKKYWNYVQSLSNKPIRQNIRKIRTMVECSEKEYIYSIVMY